MTKVKQGYCYEGTWESYKKNTSKADLLTKIRYDSELKTRLKNINTKKPNIVLSFVAALFTVIGISFILNMIANHDYLGMTPIMIMGFFATFLVVFLVDILLIRRIRGKSCSLKTRATISAGVAAIVLFQTITLSPYFMQESAMVATFPVLIISFVLYEAFNVISFKSKTELKNELEKELNIIAWEIREDVYQKELKPIKMHNNMLLLEGEEAYIEEPGFLSNVQSKNAGSIVTNSINTLLSRNRIDWNTIRQTWSEVNNDINRRGRNRRMERRFLDLKSQIGTVIVTNKRVIFICDNNGFTIKIRDLTNFGSNLELLSPVLTLESRSGLRSISTDAAPWLAMIIDRIKKEG